MLIAAYSCIIVMLSSLDSFLYDPWGRYDSAWFFTCGKAMINGMLPYVDFADSKGPMLWLIYGIAYLISPQSYVGICVPTIISITATLVLVYKMARIYVAPRPSLLTAFAIGVGIFNIIHFEVRAEDFCQTFMACSLFVAMRYLRDSGNRRLEIYAGISIGTSLLIKYSTAAMAAMPLVFTLLTLAFRRRWSEARELTTWATVGCLASMAPMLIYLGVRGCLPAMWNEYVANTVLTVSHEGNQGAMSSYLSVVCDVWMHQRWYALVCIMLTLCALPICFKDRRLAFMPILSAMSIAAMSMMHFHAYYMTPLVCFIAMLLIYAAMVIKRLNGIGWWATAALSLLCIYKAPQNTLAIKGGFDMLKSEAQRNSMSARACRCIADSAETERPTLVYTGGDIGLGLWAEALPGCRYWATQEGNTKEMRQFKTEEIRRNRPDFIVVQVYGVVSIVRELDTLGYRKIFDEKDIKVYKRGRDTASE